MLRLITGEKKTYNKCILNLCRRLASNSEVYALVLFSFSEF